MFFILYGHALCSWDNVLDTLLMYSRGCIIAAVAVHGAYDVIPGVAPQHGPTARLGGIFQRFIRNSATVEAIFAPVPAVYIIASLRHRDRYIGQTGSLIRRISDHFRGSYRTLLQPKGLFPRNLQRVHRYITSWHLEFFRGPPCYLCTTTPTAQCGEFFIRQLNPQLNIVPKCFKARGTKKHVSRRNARQRRRDNLLNTHGNVCAHENTLGDASVKENGIPGSTAVFFP